MGVKHGISWLALIPVCSTKAACSLACQGRSQKLLKSTLCGHECVPWGGRFSCSRGKGVFCYDYLDFFARLDGATLAPREIFFNKLGGVKCSQADYAHAQRVCNNFHCSTLKEYMELYLLSDKRLLADVFQAFRNKSLNEYQLNPAYFVIAPQLAWNALLTNIGSPIPLIIDTEMYRMI